MRLPIFDSIFDLRTAGNNKPLMSPAADSPALPFYGRPVLVSSQLSIPETQGTCEQRQECRWQCQRGIAANCAHSRQMNTPRVEASSVTWRRR